jgi:hypothetical protein
VGDQPYSPSQAQVPVSNGTALAQQVLADAWDQLFSSQQAPMQEDVRLAVLRHPLPRNRTIGEYIPLDDHRPRASSSRSGGREQAGEARADDHHSPFIEVIMEWAD